jgi:nucleotide-binding universal stress UspA family protein
MSTHGRGRISGSLIGSVARSLLQRTQEPILAVGPFADRAVWVNSDPPRPLSVPHIVACVDGSPVSESVLPVTAELSKALEMRLTILTVAEPAPPPLRADSAWRRRFGPEADADQYITELATKWSDAAIDVSGQVVYDPISPAEGVATYLDDVPAGLITLTTHARSGFSRLFAGANAAAIVRSSVVPALVVPLPSSVQV